MSDQPVIAEILRDLAAVMRECHLRWYLFGAQAAIIWGSPRLSADIDVTVELEDVPSFIDTMTRHGFDLLVSDAEFVSRTRVFPFVHRESGVPVDVVLAGPGLEEEFQNRAASVEIGDTQIPIISPEDLIVTKLLAGRPKASRTYAVCCGPAGGSSISSTFAHCYGCSSRRSPRAICWMYSKQSFNE